MKNHISLKTFIALILLFPAALLAQLNKPSIAVVDFDTRSYEINRTEIIQYCINELIRTSFYEVIDRHEVEYLAKRDGLTVEECFSRICLTETGKKLKVSKMFTGSIMRLGDKVNVTIKILDVDSGKFEKMVAREFLDIKSNELMMIRITMNELLGIANDPDIVKKLTQKSDFESSVNNPYKLKLRADGPRMGFSGFSGLGAQVLMADEAEGGYGNSYPLMFQFGYQFEQQYLNEGNFQALFEFIPSVGGLDQGRFLPSFTLLNGLRNNQNGWEFAVGPTFSLTKVVSGYYGSDDKWRLEKEIDPQPGFEPIIEKRPDSRGTSTLNTGVLFGFGKTFRSGKMNIPVNGYVIPGKNGLRFGVSFGWNGHDRYAISD